MVFWPRSPGGKSTRGCEAAGGDSGFPAAGRCEDSARRNAYKPLQIQPNGPWSLARFSTQKQIINDDISQLDSYPIWIYGRWNNANTPTSLTDNRLIKKTISNRTSNSNGVEMMAVDKASHSLSLSLSLHVYSRVILRWWYAPLSEPIDHLWSTVSSCLKTNIFHSNKKRKNPKICFLFSFSKFENNQQR